MTWEAEACTGTKSRGMMGVPLPVPRRGWAVRPNWEVPGHWATVLPAVPLARSQGE